MNTINQSLDYDVIIQDYINQHFELGEVTPTDIKFDEVYANNEKLIDIDAVEENFEFISMLFFSHKFKEVESSIEKVKAERIFLENPQPDLGKEIKPPKAIKEVGLTKPKKSGYQKPKNKKPFKLKW